MSVSAILGSRVSLLPRSSLPPTGGFKLSVNPTNVGLVIKSSSRPQKKATAHHRKTRPRKSQRWDIKRGLCVYPPLPDLPPEWTLVTEDTAAPPPLAEAVAVA